MDAGTTTDLTAKAGVAVQGGLGTIDWAVIIVYTIGIVALGLGAAYKHKKKKGEAKDYFLAGGSLRWPMIGLALFATNISCVHLVSLAQSGFDTGLLNGNFEWMAAFTLVLLGVFFAPFYIRSGVTTLPDFLEKRYNRACRDWLAVLALVSAVTIHIGFSFLTGGIIIESLLGINMYYCIIAIAILTGIYTIVGGLMAVVVTESVQTIVLVLGAAIISWFAWDKMGGWEPMMNALTAAGATEKVSMLRPHGDASGMPWYSILLGYPVLGIWYWCADQTIVQRVLGAKSEEHARVGPIFAGLIKILPVFIFVMPGLFAFTLYKSGGLDLSSITTLVEGKEVVNSKGIYAVMITQLLPQGLTGLMIAALLAALMSTVSGALNSISTLFSYDLYKRFKPDTPDHKLVGIGRIAAGGALLFAIGLVPLLNGYPSLFNGLNDIIAHIAPPVTCVFVLGVFWPRASAVSAKWTLWLGSLLGVTVFVMRKLPDSLPDFMQFITVPGFMMMAVYLLIACLFIQISISIVSPAGEYEKASKLYWKTPLEPLKDKGWPGIGNYKFLSALLLVTMGILYYIFR